VERTGRRAHNRDTEFDAIGNSTQPDRGREGTMHSLRIATGMTGLALVTAILLAAQFLSGAPALITS